MIIFENDGELDLTAAVTFGVSAKEGENPIGFFGTGLKYAMAIMMREGATVQFQIGKKVIPLTTVKNTIRGQQFQVVKLGRQKLGFTTLLGQNWEPWMAFREIYSNVLDENGAAYETQVLPAPEAGKTRIIVDGADFGALYHNLGSIFLQGVPIVEHAACDRHPGVTQYAYYRGVRILEIGPAMFTYNIKRALQLTEDRTVRDPRDVAAAIAKMVVESNDEEFIYNFLTAPKDSFERDMLFHSWMSATPSDAFKKIALQLSKKIGSCNGSAIDYFRSHCGGEVLEKTVLTLTKVQQTQLERAYEVCEGLGCIGVKACSITCVESLGDQTLGMVQSGKIYLSSRAFNMGTKALASTLFEEYTHLEHGFGDLTYEMQTYLFDRIVGLYEELQGAPI